MQKMLMPFWIQSLKLPSDTILYSAEADYIMLNFCPNPDIPNQKAEHYTEERIKAAANENLKDKIKETTVNQ